LLYSPLYEYIIFFNQSYLSMKNFLIVVLLAVCQIATFVPSAKAQDDVISMPFKDGEKYRLHGDRVNVRNLPKTDAKVVDNLPIATWITVVECQEQTFKQNNINNYWYEISYEKNGKTKTGYIWGALIALSTAEKDGVIFTFGYNTSGKNMDKAGQMRAISGGKEIGVANFESSIFWLGSSPELLIHGGRGFDEVKHVVQLNYQEGYCGGAINTEYLFWLNSKKLQHVHRTSEGADAPMFASETLTFPDDEGGKPNSLRVKREVGESGEDGEDIIESSEDFWLKWNGVSLKRPNKD
jgi:hypothetical protein